MYGCAATTERRLVFFIKGDLYGDFMKFGKKGERRGEHGTRRELSDSDPDLKSVSDLDLYGDFMKFGKKGERRGEDGKIRELLDLVSDLDSDSCRSVTPSKLASTSVWSKSSSSTSEGRLGLLLAMTSAKIDSMKSHRNGSKPIKICNLIKQ